METKWLAVPASVAFRAARQVAGLALVLAAAAGVAHAGGPLPSPEINAGAAVSALAFLAGGLLILTDRCRRK